MPTAASCAGDAACAVPPLQRWRPSARPERPAWPRAATPAEPAAHAHPPKCSRPTHTRAHTLHASRALRPTMPTLARPRPVAERCLAAEFCRIAGGHVARSQATWPPQSVVATGHPVTAACHRVAASLCIKGASAHHSLPRNAARPMPRKQSIVKRSAWPK